MSIPRVFNMLGLEDTRAVNMPMLCMVLCELYFKDSWYFEFLSFKYAKVYNVSGV